MLLFLSAPLKVAIKIFPVGSPDFKVPCESPTCLGCPQSEHFVSAAKGLYRAGYIHLLMHMLNYLKKCYNICFFV